MANFTIPGVCAPSLAQPICESIAQSLGGLPDIQLDPSTPATLLGSALKADWDSRSGIAATTWTDVVGSRVLTATGSPTYGADGSFFNGLSVWQCAVGQILASASAFTAIVTSGQDVYMSLVARIPTPTNAAFLYFCRDSGINSFSSLVMSGTTAFTLFWSNSGSGMTYPPGTTVHRYEMMNVSGISYFGIDGTFRRITAVASARSLQKVGLPVIVADSISNANIASFRIVTPVPTGLQRQQLRAYDSSVWGSP